MTVEILRADPRLRRRSAMVLAMAALAAVACVIAFHRWLSDLAAILPTDMLIVQLRAWIGLALTASGLCLLLLAGYAARLARRVTIAGRWPLADARVLRDTPIRRDADARRFARQLNVVAALLIALAIVVGAIGMRMTLHA